MYEEGWGCERDGHVFSCTVHWRRTHLRAASDIAACRYAACEGWPWERVAGTSMGCGEG